MSEQGPKYPRPLTFPKPFTPVLANELCRCTHFRTQHAPRDGPALGQGQCLEPACICGMFTWKAFILGGFSDGMTRFLTSITPSLPPDWLKDMDKLEREIEHLNAELVTANRAMLQAASDHRDTHRQLSHSFDEIGRLSAMLSTLTTSVRSLYVRERSILIEDGPNAKNK